jgi:uridine phosphorylase
MAFPLHPEKFTSPPVFNPSDLLAYHVSADYRDTREPGVPAGAILCYHRGLADHLSQRHAMTRYEGFFGDVLMLDDSAGAVGLVANFGIGAPAAAVMLEDLAVRGTTRFVSIGTTGALQPQLRIGDLVLCERAIRDEGTSHHYRPSIERLAEADAELTASLRAALDERGLAYAPGTAWTTDAPYRETEAEVRAHQAAGVLCVEMEAAALFSVGAFRGVRVGSILTVSDSLAADDWDPAFHAEATLQGLETLFDVASDVLRAVPVKEPAQKK